MKKGFATANVAGTIAVPSGRPDEQRSPAKKYGLVGASLALMSCAGHRHHGHAHGDWSHLDDPGRAEWQKPHEVVAALGLSEGLVVADVGAGTGYFEPLLSQAVGAGGKVLALDVSPQLVEQLRERVRSLGNVEVRLVSPVDPALESVDRVLIVDVWHHLEERVAYAQKLRAALRPRGRVVVVDYERDSPEGPPPELRLSSDVVVAELREAGFASVRLATETLPRQFVVVAE